MDRNELLSLAIKYSGNYGKIKSAIEKGGKIEKATCDYNYVTIVDEDYPKNLLNNPYPPFVLFYKGNLDLLKETKVGIIGSRAICDYAREATKILCERLNGAKKVVVSGLAMGVDAYAHYYSDRSIGVLPCGIDQVYPEQNKKLYEKLEKDGLILSEYPAGVKADKKLFLSRNRIVAGLADCLCVMQVNKGSGTSSTVNRAKEIGKTIKILPYRVTDREGIYNNELIKLGYDPLLFEMAEERTD